MPVFTIKTPRGDEVDIDAPDEATAIRGATRWDHEDFATSEATAAGLDPSLVLRQMNQESGFKADARSPKGAQGLMQLMPGTARELGVDPNDPYDNIRGGVRYLKQQMDTFGSEDLALAAYNAGPGAVKKHGGVPPYTETQNYVKAIQGAPRAALPMAADPGGATPPQAPALPQIKPTAQALRPSQSLGFMSELARVAQRIPQVPNAFDLIPGQAEKRQQFEADTKKGGEAYLARRAAAGERPGEIGKFGADVLATIAIPGGPMASGAIGGALLADKSDPGSLARNALYGAVGGKVGSSVVGGVGRAIRGVTDDGLQMLAKKGVPLTLGQMSGGLVKCLEDRLAGLPVIDDMVNAARGRSLEGANRAAFNDVLKIVGEKLPDDVPIGADAYNHTYGRLGELYDEVLTPLTIARDGGWNQAVTAISAKAAKLPKQFQDELKAVVKMEVADRFDPSGAMSGENVKAVQESLRGHIDDLMKGTKWSRDAAGVLKDVRSAVDDLVARIDPVAGEQLSKINRAYANLKPVERAVAASSKGSANKAPGVFTGNQLATAAMVGKRPGQKAAGNLPQLPLAQAMSTRLPSSVPDSGTAGRLILPSMIAGLAGSGAPVLGPMLAPAAPLLAAGAGLASIYTRGGQKAVTKLMTSRNPAMRKIGQELTRLVPLGSSAGAVAAVNSRK